MTNIKSINIGVDALLSIVVINSVAMKTATIILKQKDCKRLYK